MYVCMYACCGVCLFEQVDSNASVKAPLMGYNSARSRVAARAISENFIREVTTISNDVYLC